MDDDMEDKKYLIIMSTGKSGSYLLMGLLDWHPEVLVFPTEENFVDDWLSLQVSRCGIDKQINTQNLPFSKLKFVDVFDWHMKHHFYLFEMAGQRAKDEKQTRGRDYSNVNYSTFVSRLASVKKSEIDIIEWLSAIFESYRDSVEKHNSVNPQYFAFKTTFPSSFTRYTDILPNAKFIHLVRHPYDTFNSFKRNQIINKKLNYFRGDYDLLENMIEKKLAPLFDNVNSALHFRDQHYIIKYEDIVLNPRRETMRLCEWLNISWNENMIVPTLAGKPFIQQSENRNVKHDGSISTKRTSVFTETLGNTEVRLIDYLFYDSMRLLGYSTKYGISRRSLLCLILGLMLPFKLELKNWRFYSIIGMFSRRLFILLKVTNKSISRLMVEWQDIEFTLKKVINRIRRSS